jgi:hypothetical protein
MMTEPNLIDRPAAPPADPAVPRFTDPTLHQLFEELRGLAWVFPGQPVPPEADEADFDNMPV